jgi:cell division protein FtsW
MATYVGVGITLMLGIQTILIVGGTLRLLPLTGLTVPLVSYGGTSMLVTLFALGVILGIGTVPRRRVEPFSVKRGVLN